MINNDLEIMRKANCMSRNHLIKHTIEVIEDYERSCNENVFITFKDVFYISHKLYDFIQDLEKDLVESKLDHFRKMSFGELQEYFDNKFNFSNDINVGVANPSKGLSDFIFFQASSFSHDEMSELLDYFKDCPLSIDFNPIEECIVLHFKVDNDHWKSEDWVEDE